MATLSFFRWVDPPYILVESPDTSITIQELVTTIRNYEDEPGNLDLAKIAEASGKVDLGGSRQTGITLSLLGDWRIKFADRAGPSITLCQISDGNIKPTNEQANEVILPADYVFVTIQGDTSAGLVEGSGGATADEVADAVWDEARADHTDSGSFGEWVGKKLLTTAKFLGLK